jgi:hemerythrin
MALIWTEELATGNEAVDTQHRQLVKTLNDFLSACSSGQGREQLNSAMKFLIDYTVKHFSDEEKLQLRYRYPDYASHKKSHDNFKIAVSDLEKQINEKGAFVALVTKVNTSAGGWIINHIQHEDKKMAVYISQRAA